MPGEHGLGVDVVDIPVRDQDRLALLCVGEGLTSFHACSFLGVVLLNCTRAELDDVVCDVLDHATVLLRELGLGDLNGGV